MHFIQKLEPGTFCVPQLTHSSGAAATIPAATPRVGVAHKRGGSAAERYKGPGRRPVGEVGCVLYIGIGNNTYIIIYIYINLYLLIIE